MREVNQQPLIRQGQILIYRVFDVAEEVDLTRVEATLRQNSDFSRIFLQKPNRKEVIIRDPPVTVPLPEVRIAIDSKIFSASMQARIWNYGAVTLTFQMPIPAGFTWSELVQYSAALSSDSLVTDAIDLLAREKLKSLLGLIEPALVKPRLWDTFEDYIIYFLEKVENSEGQVIPLSDLTQRRIPELIFGERKEILSEQSLESVRASYLQYSVQDLVAIDWNTAVVIEPSGVSEIPDVLEYALTHLLEFRFFDHWLDDRLGELYDSVEGGGGGIWRSKYAQISKAANQRYLEINEFTERVENSLKVVGDFYLAVVLRAAIRRFRIPDWQNAVSKKTGSLAQVSELLQGEINVHRGHLMEMIVIFLIIFEIVQAFFH